MGEQFTLADVNYAPFLARLDGLRLLAPWTTERAHVARWWHNIQTRPSFKQARVGPSEEESIAMGAAGDKAADAFKAKRKQYLAQYGRGVFGRSGVETISNLL